MTKYEKYSFKDKVITINSIMKLNPCYSKDKILEMSGGKKSLMFSEFMKLKTVRNKHKIWLAIRVLPDKTLHSFACDCAEKVLVNYEREYPIMINNREVIKAKRLWLDGKITDRELKSVEIAAWSVSASAEIAAEIATKSATWLPESAVWLALSMSAESALTWQVRQILKYMEGSK